MAIDFRANINYDVNTKGGDACGRSEEDFIRYGHSYVFRSR